MGTDPQEKGVDEIIDDMKLELQVSTDRELADALKLNPTTISAWRRRNSVPKKYFFRFKRITNEWSARSATGVNFYQLRDGYIFALVGIGAIELKNRVLTYTNNEDEEIWRGFRLYELHNTIEREFRWINPNDPDKLRNIFESLRQKILSDEFIDWIEELKL